MTTREILCYPAAQLRLKSSPVTEFNEELHDLIKDMFDTMQEAEGIGLAAIQIGKPLRIAVINVEKPFVMINPILKVTDPTPVMREEGCLSVPGIRAEITRPSHIMVVALDQNRKEFRLSANGLLAVCLQHEIDHMDGMLFIDRLSPLKRSSINAQLRNLIALYQNTGAP